MLVEDLTGSDIQLSCFFSRDLLLGLSVSWACQCVYESGLAAFDALVSYILL